MGNTTYTIREAKKALLDMFKTYFAKDENGDSVLGKMIADFIKSRRKPF